MSNREFVRNPKLTIGIPAYRNARTIQATVESVLAQGYGDLKVVISDDASPDNTAELCRAIAATDPRITFLQQPKNLNYGNFRYLVNPADTEYFMWLAGDDRIAPDYVKENLKVLEARDDVVLSVSRCMFVKGDQEVGPSTGTYPLMESVVENLANYLSGPSDNTRMYGIFRTAVLKRSLPPRDFHAYDWALAAASLLYGKHHECPEVMIYRDYTPPKRYVELARRDGGLFALRAFPLLPMSIALLRRSDFPRSRRLRILLASLNIEHHVQYSRRYHPNYARLLPPLIRLWQRHMEWRANVLGQE